MTTATFQTLVHMMDDREITLESYINNYLKRDSSSEKSQRLYHNLIELKQDYKRFKSQGQSNTNVDLKIMTNRFDNLYAMYLALSQASV